MKIILNGSYAPSLVNFRGPFIQELIKRGHEVHAVAPDIDDIVAEKLSAFGAVSHNIPLNRAGTGVVSDLKYFNALRKLFKQIEADLVVSYTIKPNIWGSLAAASNSIRSASMVTGLGYAFIPGEGLAKNIISKISQRLYRWATSANDVVIFQNPDDRRDFLAAGCLTDPDKARMVNGSGVDLHHYKREELPDQGVFLMIARLLGNKGVREYAAAASILKKKGYDWRFFLAGFLDEGPDCVSSAELEAWQADAIEFLGELEDVRPALAAASIYVLPSYREGTPRSVLEAMAMGRPIITSDAPGCRETVESGINGYLTPVGDPNELAKHMEALGLDAALRQKMGQASFERAKEKYAVEMVNEELTKHLSL